MNKEKKYNYENIPTPCFVVEEELLRNNLEILKSVIDETGCKIFDKIIIAVSFNCNKKGFLEPQIRKELIHEKNIFAYYRSVFCPLCGFL